MAAHQRMVREFDKASSNAGRRFPSIVEFISAFEQWQKATYENYAP